LEAAGFSGTFVPKYQITRHHVPENDLQNLFAEPTTAWNSAREKTTVMTRTCGSHSDV
jgi:hypothetical protein